MTQPTDKKSYKTTLNLPQTPFAMEAKLVTNEPKRLATWQKLGLYERLLQARADAPTFVLHDGPPFANGDIHMGHLANKTLKDVILRYKSMSGFRTPYVPGWDCHGLPIEHKIQQDLGKQFRELPPIEVRKKCADYAAKFASVQGEQFQRLGILGDWSNPYLTMTPDYEAATLEVFAKIVEKNLVYKQLKTVPWSIANQTALADAELEYVDVKDKSIYVAFPSANPGEFKARFGIKENAKVSFLIWTTTPWTLPANLAIAVGPEVDYALVRYQVEGQSHVSVVAEALAKNIFEMLQTTTGIETPFDVLTTVKGTALRDLKYTHPFIDRTAPVLTADYVTTTDGTGLVHTAPGHGEDDYNTGVANGLDIYCPVLLNGRFDSSVPNWLTGQTVWEGNKLVVEKLRELGLLFAEVPVLHSYPHDWRSKTPIIFRATEQWFIAMDKPVDIGADVDAADDESSTKPGPARTTSTLREQALRAAADEIGFVPRWGKARLTGMLTTRPDWCISRQRSWGLPIPVFYNEANEPLLTSQSVRAVARVFAEKGSNAWFELSPAELLAGCDTGERFPKDQLRKEKDIFDVWFESGSSWNGVLKAREQSDSVNNNLHYPADLYLEGSDQHRGWFQLSLLASLAATGQMPFKGVLTHGFIVGPDGRKISKSDKNYVTAVTEIERHGADLLRLFVCHLDFERDMAASPKLITEFGDNYRKIRNTIRFLLSNLYDYQPTDSSPPHVPQSSLDGLMLWQTNRLVADVTAAYETCELHKAFRLLHEFCSVKVSSVYATAMKDRLYCDAADSPLRRRAQFVMHTMAVKLIKLLAPMLVFTADEAWEHVPAKPPQEADLPSVHLCRLPVVDADSADDEQHSEWAEITALRADALAQLDRLKKLVGLNKSIDAEVVYTLSTTAAADRLRQYGVDLEDMVGCGFHSIEVSPEIGDTSRVQVVDRRDRYPACARSWKRRPDVGTDADYPDLSTRDAIAVRKQQVNADGPTDV